MLKILFLNFHVKFCFLPPQQTFYYLVFLYLKLTLVKDQFSSFFENNFWSDSSD